MEEHTATFKTFNILFDHDGAYTPGQEITGVVVFYPIRDVQLSPVRLVFLGTGTLYDPRTESVIDSTKYWEKTVHLGATVCDYKAGQEHSIPFKETLPLNLEGSMECRSLQILYSITARFTYRSTQNEVRPLTTARGFTVISPVHLDYVDSQRFKPSSYSVSKKHGWIPCLSGHISLKVNVERSAYLAGESIVLEGEVKNDSSRRIENVKGIFQKTITVMALSAGSPKIGIASCEKPSLGPISTETLKVKEEFLALFVDPHATTKISRNFGAPTVRPSTFDHIHIGHYSVSITYELLIKVHQLGEVCSVAIPLFIGSVPHQTVHTKKPFNPWMDDLTVQKQQKDDEQRVHYQRDVSERPSSLFDSSQTYLTRRGRMMHVNVFPYYAYLQTSSKQSRQFKMLATAVKADSAFMSRLRNANPSAVEGEAKPAPSTETTTIQEEQPSVDSVQQMLPEKLILVQPAEGNSPLAKATSPSSSSRWSKLKPSPDRRKSSLPPVEISISDSTCELQI